MARERFFARGLMFNSIQQGFNFTAFYNSAKGKGFIYNRNEMTRDFREVQAEVENNRSLRSVSSGEIPPHIEITSQRIAYSEPYIYKARVGTQMAFGGPITEQFVTVLSKSALTMEEIADQVSSKWGGWGYAKAERVVQIEPMVALHKID